MPTSDPSEGRTPLPAVIVAILLAVTAVGVMVYLPSALEDRGRASIEREAVGLVSVAASVAAPALHRQDFDALARTVDGLALSPEVSYVVVRSGGETLESRRAEAAVEVGTASGVGARYADGLLHVAVAVPGVEPLATVQIGYTLDGLRATERGDALLSALVASILLVGAVAAGMRARRAPGPTFGEEGPPEDTTTKVFAGDAFIAYLSHELRTPLSAILGYAEILQEDAIHLDQPDLVPDLRQIQRAGTHMLALVDDVVSLQRVFSGTLDLEITTFEVSELLEEVQRDLASLINRTLTTLDVDRSPDVRKMTADRHKLSRALTNVVREAAGATGQGELSLSVRREIEVAGRAWIRFAITHPDLEISEHEITQMIRGFGEERARALPQYHGTGLGLVISREFCRAQGGDLIVRPEGKGTVFELKVPQNVR